MAGNPSDLWRVPVYLPYLQPPLTDAAIAAAEHQLGVRLPAELIAALRVQNGGYIRYSLPGTVHSLIAGIGPNFPSLTDFDWEDSQEYVNFELQGLVPFDGDGHWHLCLDYRTSPGSPAITLIDVDADEEQRIADSFADYLGHLEIDHGDELVITSAVDGDALRSRLAATLGTQFGPPDTWAHGYPVHRLALGTPGNPEWLWFSPNRVPRGFVRTDDTRFPELRDLLPGSALRFPELPGDSHLIGTTDGVRERVTAALAAAGFDVQPIRRFLNP